MASDPQSFGPPRGMRDFYPEDMVLRERIFDAWTEAARQFGFSPYDACVVESLDLLKRKSGEEIVDQIYCFTDKSGRELALRPEMTPTLARMIAARQGALGFPLKWYTVAQCFRYERMTRGRKREHYQWNLDIVGEPSCSAEVEVIGAAVQALLTMGLPRDAFQVHFSSRALLGDLLLSLGIEPSHHPATFLALDKRGKMPDADIRQMVAKEGLDESAVNRVFDLLNIASIQDAAGILKAQPQSYTDVLQFLDLADAAGLGSLLKFDIAVIRGLSYYTGIVFEAFDTPRVFRAIFGGGRYDRLLDDIGGRSASGVGLGFGDVVIGEFLTELGLAGAPTPPSGIRIGYMEEAQRRTAFVLAATLRKTGQVVDLGLSPEKARNFFAGAAKSICAEAVYLGPDDVARGTARAKNLATREEREIPLG